MEPEENAVPVFSLPEVESILRSLTGDVLTVIEAAHQDPVQREATKTLVRSAINKRLDAARASVKAA